MATQQELRVVGLAGSPTPGGSTSAAVAAMLAGAAGNGCATVLVELARTSPEQVAGLVDAAGAVIVGSPVYRATYSALTKSVLERIDRGRAPGEAAPLRGKAAAIVLAGASGHHFLTAEHGAALADLARAVQGSSRLRALEPLV